MTATGDLEKRQKRFRAIIGMLSSSNDGQRIAALNAADRFLEAHGLCWSDLADSAIAGRPIFTKAPPAKPVEAPRPQRLAPGSYDAEVLDAIIQYGQLHAVLKIEGSKYRVKTDNIADANTIRLAVGGVVRLDLAWAGKDISISNVAM
ncbi:hypothetical protein [Croceicoccus gelatinilyticus]|uniref:hypothetical protein n=1 Tax=Croceicoccus gelatinilyticus TaxID=2835536 RepID=UPI001BCBF092|nr:hypothetical protein [Croceicoccus gelatinilyticus]MBS7671731.1 hypothetical protein [Croceicoccus gelatinilyticus]